MKRTPLKRKTRLKQRATRRPDKRSAYRSRERDTAFMLWVKTLPCMAEKLSPCGGVIEADHTGGRGIGRKADDRTCIPLCTRHHRERTDWTGPFKTWSQEEMRAFLSGCRDFVAYVSHGRFQS